MNQTESSPWSWGQLLVVLVLAVLALMIRLYYVHTAVVDHPLRGDALQYFAYALNLADHQVFSMVPPGGVVTPDGFRDPGYPAFLALLVTAVGREQAFYVATLDAQCLLSAGTVLTYVWLSRRWLGMTAAVVTGLSLAFWPHAITLAGCILSETLIGFLFAGGLLTLQLALDRESRPLAGGAGIFFALAALTNVTLLPLAPLFGIYAAWRDRARRSLWIAMVVAATVPCAAWTIRGAELPPSPATSDRAVMNFVQGSWPEYHTAWYSSVNHENKYEAIMQSIDSEYRLMRSDNLAGLAFILRRLTASPLRYAAWYLSKPMELWGWTIGIGAGDIYVFPTFNSPLSGTGPLRVTTDLLFLLNPVILLFAALGAIAVLARPGRWQPSLVLATIGVGFLTIVFTVLQSDARYSLPYRGIEFALACAGITTVARKVGALTHRHRLRVMPG